MVTLCGNDVPPLFGEATETPGRLIETTASIKKGGKNLRAQGMIPQWCSLCFCTSWVSDRLGASPRQWETPGVCFLTFMSGEGGGNGRLKEKG